MSKDAEEVNKLTESTYKNVMEQFNPGLRNLVNLGKNYEKSVAAMTLAGKLYFDAMAKIGENAAVSPVSKELGVVLMEISEVHRKVHLELEENLKRFHREIITELERKTDMDVKYMTATFKRYQMEHKVKQDSMERSQSDLKKLRRKSQGKNANKYESKESECLETLTSRQMDMQRFLADGCKEALLEEKRRFCFLVDKHCMFSYQFATFHDKARDILMAKLPSWQDQCNDATNVPENILAMIEGLRTPISIMPLPSPSPSRHSVNMSVGRDSTVAPPAPPLKAQTSPLANMFTQENTTTTTVSATNNSTNRHSDHANGEDASLPRSVSVSTGLNNMVKRPRVRTIFPHTAGNNNTLLSFDEGDVIILLIPEERDGWMYGELEKNGKRGWFPSSYCRAFSEPLVNNNSASAAPYRSRSVVNLHHQDTETDEATMVLPPADYCDSPQRNSSITTNNNHRHSPTPSAASSSSDQNTVNQPNGVSRPPPAYLAGGNPFATVRLRPTVTNDRSAPVI
ncbi:hypothetical protein LDENG_00242940 [Lucifuga dentata]|nr:hypothetical protein LDENG_00242940 [Lucifuga dentata]